MAKIIFLALVFVAIVGVATAATEVEVAKGMASGATEVDVAKGDHHDQNQSTPAAHTHDAAAKAPAAETAKAPVAEAIPPMAEEGTDQAEAPTVVGSGGESIGATDGAAPTTSELGPVAAEAVAPAADKKNGASALRVPAAVAGVVAVAAFLSF